MIKHKDVVVLVVSNKLVSLILTSASIEVHAAPLESAQQDLVANGYRRGARQDICFPTAIPETVQLKGATRLEVWVKD